MAATFRSSSTANTGTTASLTLGVTMPAGVVVGDLLLAAISVDAVPAITPNSEWTLVKSVSQSTAPTSKLSIYYHQVTGYEPASYTWTFAAAKQAAGLIVAYSGTSGFSPAAAYTNSSSTAATALSNVSVTNTWSGLMLSFWGTRNTTGQSTITAATGWTGRVDTCTTASAFMEVEAQESPAQTLPAAVTQGSTIGSTASQSVTSIVINIPIDDAHTRVPLVLDEVFKATWTASQATANTVVSTNYPNELLIACVCLESGASLSVSSITGAGLTFTQLGAISTARRRL